jgi:hypothetical protein
MRAAAAVEERDCLQPFLTLGVKEKREPAHLLQRSGLERRNKASASSVERTVEGNHSPVARLLVSYSLARWGTSPFSLR